MATWQCINGCGACCHLDPGDRPDLDTYLDPESLGQYLGLVGEDGWCLNFDHEQRTCRIYDDRPWFCRVEAASFGRMFDLEAEEVNGFAIDCCQEHIDDLYGPRSLERLRFDRAVNPPTDEPKVVRPKTS